MALRFVISSKMPLVIILGATGTGKTKLSVELASMFNAEVISADSMQVYKGLDIVTAKATPQERGQVPHHLLDLLEPHQMFTVVDFRNRALGIIDNLMQQGKMPIVVGGTNYYIESIVYNILVEDSKDSNSLLWDRSRRKRDVDDLEEETNVTAVKKKPYDDIDKYVVTEAGTSSKASTVTEETVVKKEGSKTKEDTSTETSKELVTEDTEANKEDKKTSQLTKEELQNYVNNEKQFSSENIHDKLKAIDPVMASKLHPNNRRKVLRSLEVWLGTGRLYSEILAEQKLSEGRLRKPGATIVFWLKCEQTVHDTRLDARVDAMIAEGLIQELLDFHERHNLRRIQDGQPPDYTKGVFQTLGFKEFHEYLMLSEEARNSEGGKKLLQISIENMKLATRRYARRQNKMVRGRFLEHPNREIPPIFELDTTDIAKWDEEVSLKAKHIIESSVNGTLCEYQPLTSCIEEEKMLDSNSSNYCEVCERIIIGDRTYRIHLNSYKHKKVLKKKNKLANSNAKDVTEKPDN